MSRESVRRYFVTHAPDIVPIDLTTSTATVAEAAQALGVEPGQIAKTLALRVGEMVCLVVMSGTGRLDNRKAKEVLGGRPRMVSPEDALALTGHPVGGVCPFGLPDPMPVFCDRWLLEYDIVWPAAGDRTSAVALSPARLAGLTQARWVDIVQD